MEKDDWSVDQMMGVRGHLHRVGTKEAIESLLLAEMMTEIRTGRRLRAKVMTEEGHVRRREIGPKIHRRQNDRRGLPGGSEGMDRGREIGISLREICRMPESLSAWVRRRSGGCWCVCR